MAGATLVAGVGNVFLGDDGFGVEVVARLRGRPLPAEVKVADFGIRGLHLAYELLDGGYQTTILVDATQRGGAPGTVYLIQPDLETTHRAGEPAATTGTAAPGAATSLTDAHGMTPDAVFRLLQALGGKPSPRVLVVGCEPASIEERMGLSDAVESSVEEAIRLILDLLPPRSTMGDE